MTNQPLDVPEPNLPLLRKVLDHIDAHPDEWRQSVYGVQTEESTCGTAFCIAGHAAVMAGAEPIWHGDGGMTGVTDPEGGGWVEVLDFAVGALGLTYAEATYLFDGGNTRDEVQEYAARIAERAGETL